MNKRIRSLTFPTAPSPPTKPSTALHGAGLLRDALSHKQDIRPQSAPKTNSQQPQRKTTRYKILWDALNVLAGRPGCHAWPSPAFLPPHMSQVQPHLQLGSKCHPHSVRSFFLGHKLSSLDALCKISHSTLPLGHPMHLPFFTTSKLMTHKTQARTCLQTPRSNHLQGIST